MGSKVHSFHNCITAGHNEKSGMAFHKQSKLPQVQMNLGQFAYKMGTLNLQATRRDPCIKPGDSKNQAFASSIVAMISSAAFSINS